MAKTVVAISSFVMRGTIGLRAILFALERRGAAVWAVPTVLVPWQPGLGPSTWHKVETLPQQLPEIAQYADQVDAVLTGYFGNPAQIGAAAKFIDAVRAVRDDALVVVDPVTGDEDGRYVSDGVAEALCNDLLPRADVATPNVNELRDLAGDTSDDAARSLGAKAIIVTSSQSDAQTTTTRIVEGEKIATLSHRSIGDPARGTGDLFSGVLTSALLETPGDLTGAARSAAAATLAVLAVSDPISLNLPAAQDAIAHPDLETVKIG